MSQARVVASNGLVQSFALLLLLFGRYHTGRNQPRTTRSMEVDIGCACQCWGTLAIHWQAVKKVSAGARLRYPTCRIECPPDRFAAGICQLPAIRIAERLGPWHRNRCA